MKNQTGKYLKYAIGEIILVVIGILIALQINNWNEENKNSKKEIYILKELRQEFAKDSTHLERYILLTDGKTKDGILVKKAIQENKRMALDSLTFKLFFNGRLVLFESSTPTYDELVSTGNLSLIKNDSLKKLIKNYKSDLEGQKTFFFYEAQRRKEAYNNHLFHYFEPQTMSAFWEGETPEQILSYESDAEGLLNDPNTLYHVNTVIGVDRELNWIYSERTIQKISGILKSIDDELSKKSND